jgi:acyl carrier protein
MKKRFPTHIRVTNLSTVITVVRDLAAAGALPGDLVDVTLDEDTTLESLGLDSMARLELLAELEDRVDANIPEAELSGIRTIGELSAAVGVALSLAREAA